MQLRIHPSITELAESEWDALLDAQASPFVRWAWLEALEHAGCVRPETGWTPCHLSLRQDGRLLAAAPAYLKGDSDGDFARDWGWAEGAARAGLAYYPKLLLTVPFTPVPGRRLLVHPEADRAACTALLATGAKELAREVGAAGVHLLFPLEEEARALGALGYAERLSYQYHWRNPGYRDPEEFLRRFDSKRRNQARRERAAPAAQGITIRTVRGPELASDPLSFGRAAFSLHRATIDRLPWGRRWLDQGFYERVFQRMPEALELVEARREGALVAGAFNLASPTHLYGRYWGCFEEHKFLHFNVCLYHSIDECIRRGVGTFEGGAGGEHKLIRGFEPAETHSAHLLLDERLHQPIARHIAAERAERTLALSRWREAAPILRHKMVLEPEAGE